jgi:hypothetical protein
MPFHTFIGKHCSSNVLVLKRNKNVKMQFLMAVVVLTPCGPHAIYSSWKEEEIGSMKLFARDVQRKLVPLNPLNPLICLTLIKNSCTDQTKIRRHVAQHIQKVVKVVFCTSRSLPGSCPG